MPIHRIKELVHADFVAVNDLILEKIQAQTGLIDDLSKHIIQSGGKRLRPLIVLLASLACGYEGKEHITLAAMIEFFHTATLLHDDVVDDSKLRRGKKTANIIWGSKASILVGDYLFTLYMKLMLEVGNMHIMHLLANITHNITCGEIKQLANKNNYNLSEDDYFDVIMAKTSLLFAISASIGGIICGSSEDVEMALYNFGLHLGNDFQLIDDALDYCSNSETTGKNIGDDLAEGKATLPPIYILQKGTNKQKDLIRESIKTGDSSNFPEILTILKETKAREYTKKVANKEIDLAINSLNILPNSKYKDALREIAYFAVGRE